MASYIVLYHTESYSIIPLKSIISHIILWHRYRITVYIMANHIVLYHTESYSIIPLKANYITHHTLSYCGNDIVSHGIIPWHLYRTVSHRIIPYHTILYYWPVSEFRMKTNAADAERCTNRNSPCRRCQLHTHHILASSWKASSICTSSVTVHRAIMRLSDWSYCVWMYTANTQSARCCHGGRCMWRHVCL